MAHATAKARTVMLELAEPELQAMLGLIDAGLRHGPHCGLRAAATAAALLGKIEGAVAQAAEPGALGAVPPANGSFPVNGTHAGLGVGAASV